MASLVLTAHYTSGDRRFVLTEEKNLIGSDASCDVVLNDPTVSRQHACLRRTGHKWWLEDLGSSNGTKVNGDRLAEAQRVDIEDGLQFGNLVCSLTQGQQDEVELAVPAQTLVDPPTPSSTKVAVATVSSDRLTRFFTETLPALTVHCASQATPDPGFIVGALVEIFGGVWTLSRNNAVLAAAGERDAALVSDQAFTHDDCTLSWACKQPLDESIFARVAESVLALSRLQSNGPAPTPSVGLDTEHPPLPEPATRHHGLLNCYRQVPRVAQSRLNVLVEGASGTGKELFARYLHACGQDRQPLVTLNCASLPQDLLDAELFGIEQGVATGVVARAGKFEQADGGVIFLDEIGDMHPATQAKLLRVLQEQEVFRVGGSKPRKARIQVVSATNRNLKHLVDSGEFRLDLYHRIADWTVLLPDLQERMVDIVNLAAHFLRAGCEDMGHRFGGISRAALECLQHYSWPGNVRELEREMKRCALFLEDGEPLRSDHLSDRIRVARSGVAAEGPLKAQLAHTEKRAIEQALQLSRGDVARAAERLGVGKSTLYRQIRKLGIDTG